MRGWVLVALLAAAFLAAMPAQASALSPPVITFIPDKITNNSAFIAIADVQTTPSESVALTWDLKADQQADEINYYGSFPKAGGKYACYFSDTDNESTCGPVPYEVPNSPRKFYVKAIDQYNTSVEREENLSVGEIVIRPSIYVNGRNITMIWPNAMPTFAPNGLRYRLYYAANLTEANRSGIVPFDSSGIRGYSFDIPAGPGEYFISLSIDAGSSGFGGSVFRVEVPALPLSALPSGAGSLSVEPASFEVMLNKGQSFEKTSPFFSMTNVGGSTLQSVSVDIPSEYLQYVSVAVDNSTIAPNGTTYYSVTVIGTQHAMEINTTLNVSSNGTVVGQLPLDIKVSVVNECEGSVPVTCQSSGGSLSASPQLWSGKYLAGSAASLLFSLSNRGTGTLGNISYSSDISGLSMGLPNALLPSGSAYANASISSDTGGTKQGTITITSNNGSASIMVYLTFFPDINASISQLTDELASFRLGLSSSQQNQLMGALGGIDSDLGQSLSMLGAQNYEEAQNYYNSASAKFSAISSVSLSQNAPAPPIPDLTMVIIIVAVVVAALAAFMFIKKRKSGGNDEELENQLAEEFGPLPDEGKQ